MDATLSEMPRLIQAGMGVRVSSCTLANTTSRLGGLGVVSAVGLRHIVIEEIRQGRSIETTTIANDGAAYNQFATLRPGTLSNSRLLFVTRVARRLIACAAINISMEPIGRPLFSSPVLMEP